MHQVRSTRLLALALAAGSAACSAAGIRGASYVIVDTATNERVEFDTFVDRVTSADVLFLGEQHDNTTCHELQHIGCTGTGDVGLVAVDHITVAVALGAGHE